MSSERPAGAGTTMRTGRVGHAAAAMADAAVQAPATTTTMTTMNRERSDDGRMTGKRCRNRMIYCAQCTEVSGRAFEKLHERLCQRRGCSRKPVNIAIRCLPFAPDLAMLGAAGMELDSWKGRFEKEGDAPFL
jgi:hypothetical protein